MTTKVYSESDYKGEFNLLKAEKDLITKVYKMVKGNQKKIGYIVGLTERTINTKIRLHQIKKELK